MRSPLLALAASFALGIVVARFVPARVVGIGLLLPLIGGCLLAGLAALQKETKQIEAQAESAQQVFDKMVQELSFDVKL